MSKMLNCQFLQKRTQIHSAYRLKKFINPADSKFLDEKKKKMKSSDKGEENKLVTDQLANEERVRAQLKRTQDNLI